MHPSVVDRSCANLARSVAEVDDGHRQYDGGKEKKMKSDFQSHSMKDAARRGGHIVTD